MTMNRFGVVSLDAYKKVMEDDDNRFVRTALDSGPSFLPDTKLYQDAWKMQDAIVDKFVPANALTVAITIDNSNGRALPLLLVGDEEYQFTATSFGQLCEKSGMGVTSYMKKCITSGLPSLVPQNLNMWLMSQGNKELMVRFCGNSVIAFLSNKYGVFDHGDALDCLSTALGKHSNYSIEAYALSVDNMSVRLVDTEQILIPDASHGRDRSTAGLIFRNGQTGRSLASIEFLVYTFACTNGLIVSQDRGIVYKRRHISIDRHDFTEQITATLEQFPAYVASARQDMEKARQVRISVDMHAALKQQIQKGLSIGEETVEEIFDMMHNQWDDNAWGLSGAITEVAQKFSAERQYQFEKYAGELVRQLAA